MPCTEAQQTVRERLASLVFTEEELWRVAITEYDIDAFRHVGNCPEHDQTCTTIGHLLKSACMTNVVPQISEPLQ